MSDYKRKRSPERSSSSHRHGRSPSHKREKHRSRHSSRERSSHDGIDEKRRRKYNDREQRAHCHLKVKTEEEFDRRQERARQNRIKEEYQVKQEREYHDDRRREHRQQQNNQVNEAFADNKTKQAEKEKPNLGLSGLLTADTNTYKGVVIKYSEPPEARVPKRKWRLYPFKGEEKLKIMHMHRQSAYLFGRLARIADIPIHHPSCSKQHAVFQYRAVEKKINGVKKRVVRPYIIDLNSGNGTFLNGQQIEAQRYFELQEKDVLKFGLSSRDYVLLHDKTDTSEVVGDDSADETDNSDDDDVEKKKWLK